MTNVHAMMHKPTDADRQAVPMVELCIHGGGHAKFRRGLTVANDAQPAVQRLKLVLAECANDLDEDSSHDRLAGALLTFLQSNKVKLLQHLVKLVSELIYRVHSVGKRPAVLPKKLFML